jgi:hypothetical protein
MSRKDLFRHIKTIDQFILPFIQQTLALPPDELEKLTKSDKTFTFLHHLAIFTRDPKVMRDQLVGTYKKKSTSPLKYQVPEFPLFP